MSDGYPLRGKLRIAPALNVPMRRPTACRPPATVWLDERLAGASRSQSATGSNWATRASGGRDPDAGAGSRRLVLQYRAAPDDERLDDVAATGLIQTGSRVTYHLLVAGEGADAQAFEQAMAPRLGRGESLQSLAHARPEIRAALDRAQQFVGLTAMLAVILAAVAIALATRRYTQRHLDGYAVMRCLGATQARLFALLSGEFAVLGVAACAVGCAVRLRGAGVIAVVDRRADRGAAAAADAAAGAAGLSPSASCCCSASRCRRCCS